MKLTKSKLKQIIEEEMETLASEGIFRDLQRRLGKKRGIPAGAKVNPEGSDLDALGQIELDMEILDQIQDRRELSPEEKVEYKELEKQWYNALGMLRRGRKAGKEFFTTGPEPLGKDEEDILDKLTKESKKAKLTKQQLEQIIREELSKTLNEAADGYYVKFSAYNTPDSFHDPEGNQLPDLDGEVEEGSGIGLQEPELISATENLPEFAKIVDKEALDAHKKRAEELGRKELGLYPDSDFMKRYFIDQHGIRDSWDKLLRLYLNKVLNIPGAQVVPEPGEFDDDEGMDGELEDIEQEEWSRHQEEYGRS